MVSMSGGRRRLAGPRIIQGHGGWPLAAVAMLALFAASAEASHFRYAHITWTRTPNTNTVTFKSRTAWEHGSINTNSCNPSDSTLSEHLFYFGDNTAAPNQPRNDKAPALCFTGPNTNAVLIGTFTDSSNATFDIIEYTVVHTYPTQGPYTAFIFSCCRKKLWNPPFDPNDPDDTDPISVMTDVDLRNGNMGSPVSTVPAIIQFRVNQVNNYTLPIADPDQDVLTCRLATTGLDSESELRSQPTAGGHALSVSSGCVLTWNTAGTTVGQFYGVQVIVEEHRPNNQINRVSLDFIIEIIDAAPPSCTGASDFYRRDVGQRLQVIMTGMDPGGGNMRVNALGSLPPGATLTPPSGTVQATPFGVLFDWTPQAQHAGQVYAVTIQFTNVATQLSAVCTFSVRVTNLFCAGPFVYTTNAQFLQGNLANVFLTPISNALQLHNVTEPFPFICVACSGRGTVVRIDINTGAVLGEYYTAPFGRQYNPSRTTVDLLGNVWTANRNEAADNSGSVVKIGLVAGGVRGNKVGGNFVPDPTGQFLQPPFQYNTCADRDGDGLIRTSRGLGSILPWADNGDGAGGVDGIVRDADDECILIYQRLPGAPNARHVSVDSNNDVWVGGFPFALRLFYKLDGNTGEILDTFNPGPIGCGGYGGFVDRNNVLWSTSAASWASASDYHHDILRYNLTARTGCCIRLPESYGLGFMVDGANQYAWASEWTYNSVVKINAFDSNCSTAIVSGFPKALNLNPKTYDRGVCVTPVDNNVWVANSHKLVDGVAIDANTVSRLDKNGNLLTLISLGSDGNIPTGVAVDTNGKVWVTCYGSSTVKRINPATNAVDLTVNLNAVNPLGLAATPYNYSDMTGSIAKQIAQQGSWTVVKDSQLVGTEWTFVRWNQEQCVGNHVPPGTTLLVRVRAAETQAGLSSFSFVNVQNGVQLIGINGRFIEVQAILTGTTAPFATPVLCDLTIYCSVPPTCSAGGPYTAACQSPTTTVALSGAASQDPDNRPLTYLWTTDCPGGNFSNPTSATPNLTISTTTGCSQCNVWLTVKDPGDLDATCSSTVTITNNTAPTFTVFPINQTVQCDGSGNSAQLNAWLESPRASDDCSQVVMIDRLMQSQQTVCGQVAKLQATWTASDECGNTATATRTFTIADSTVPVITCPPNISRPVDQDVCELITDNLQAATATDNCGLYSITSDALGTLGLGVNNVTWTATDVACNSATCVQQVTVTNTAPTITQGPGPLSLVVAGNSTCPNPANQIVLSATDPEHVNTLNWTVRTQATKGTASFLNGAHTGGSVTVCYQPDVGQCGADSFVIRTADACSATASITVNVTITPCCSSLSITSARSIRTHGGVGDFGIDLGISPQLGDVECRGGGPQQIDVVFSAPIRAVDGTLTAGDEVSVLPAPATITGLSIVGGNTLRINLSGVPNRNCLRITLHNIACDTGSGPGVVFPDTVLRQRVLLGDVSNNGTVSSADINLTKSRLGQPVTAVNFRSDTGANGGISSLDVNQIKASTNNVPVGCP